MDISCVMIFSISICFTNLLLLLINTVRLCKRNHKEYTDAIEDIHLKTSKFIVLPEAALQNANSNLNFNKTIQWNYIYYVVLLFASVFGIASEYGSDKYVAIINALAANIIFHIGFILCLDIKYQIRRERISLISIQMRFAKGNKAKADLDKRLDEAKKLFHNPYISYTLIGTVFIGYILCLAVIFIKVLHSQY